MKPVTLEDIARQYARDQGLDLRDQLLLSHFINDAKLKLAPKPKPKLKRVK